MTDDAGTARERLATELANWKARGFLASARAASWHRRTSALAKATGIARAQVVADLEGDAAAILDAEACS